jgi:signal transduction histidine kinase
MFTRFANGRCRLRWPLGEDSDVTASQEPGRSGALVSTRLVHPILRYLHAFKGAGAQAAMAQAAGLPLEELEKVRWIEHAQLEAMLGVLREFARDDDEIRAATTFHFTESYGLIRWVLWTSSPEQLYRIAARAVGFLATTSTITIDPIGPERIAIRHRCSVAESKTACIGRAAHLAALPTLCGLRPATVQESACQTEGAPECVYLVSWRHERRWLPYAFGLLLGAIAFALGLWFHSPTSGLLAAILALTLAGAWDVAREVRRQEATILELQGALSRAVQADDELRREALALDTRQRQWTELVERRTEERARALREVVARVQQLQQARNETLLGWSHDLRNPMFVLQMGVDWLNENERELPEEARAIVHEQRDALDRMRALLAELMRAAKPERGVGSDVRVPLEVRALANELHARLRAFAIRKDVHVDVTVSEHAPARFEVDALLFDRVVDNLLSNAIKYTDQGSITVEIGGTPGYVTVAVTDTGKGLGPEAIRRILEPGQPDPEMPPGESYGLGLSIVLRLLRQSGGRLEVESVPRQGTRFCAYFPLEQPPHSTGQPTRAASTSDAPPA